MPAATIESYLYDMLLQCGTNEHRGTVVVLGVKRMVGCIVCVWRRLVIYSNQLWRRWWLPRRMGDGWLPLKWNNLIP